MKSEMSAVAFCRATEKKSNAECCQLAMSFGREAREIGLCGRVALHPDVFVPKLRMGINECFHQRDALLQVQDVQLHPPRANVVFWSLECFVLTDDHFGDFIEENSAAAHITGG